MNLKKSRKLDMERFGGKKCNEVITSIIYKNSKNENFNKQFSN